MTKTRWPPAHDLIVFRSDPEPELPPPAPSVGALYRELLNDRMTGVDMLFWLVLGMVLASAIWIWSSPARSGSRH